MRPLASIEWLHPLRPLVAGALLVGAANAALVGPAHADAALARKYACTACHQTDRRLVGPSWAEVSAKYATGSVTAAQLAAVMKAGSTGKWGSVAMPPQAHVPEADLQALSAWVLNAGKGGRP